MIMNENLQRTVFISKCIKLIHPFFFANQRQRKKCTGILPDTLYVNNLLMYIRINIMWSKFNIFIGVEDIVEDVGRSSTVEQSVRSDSDRES
jgi:hypothetical protein